MHVSYFRFVVVQRIGIFATHFTQKLFQLHIKLGKKILKAVVSVVLLPSTPFTRGQPSPAIQACKRLPKTGYCIRTPNELSPDGAEQAVRYASVPLTKSRESLPP